MWVLLGAPTKHACLRSGNNWSIDDIFGDKELTRAYLRFCKSIFSEENALFYLAVERYKVMPCPIIPYVLDILFMQPLTRLSYAYTLVL